MEKLIRISANLSATKRSGRYNIRYWVNDIIKDTPKTLTIRLVGKDSMRIPKSSLLKVEADFRNDKLNRIQFRTNCYEKDLDQALDLLDKTVKETADELIVISANAEAALKKGFSVINNNEEHIK